MKKFDLAIIGGGPGGYVAALRAAKLGLSIALVEADELGGTCLNRGCIPSKTFLKHAEMVQQLTDSQELAIKVPEFSFSLSSIVNRKDKVVKQLNGGIKTLLKQNKITVFHGFGFIKNNKQIRIQLDQTEEIIEAKNIILATGSQPIVPTIAGVEEIEFHTSDTIFDVTEIPIHMVIVGGGVIGLEIACMFNSFGTKVEVIEMAERILPQEDKEAAVFLEKQLASKGVKFHINAKITRFAKTDNNKKIVEIEENGEELQILTDLVFLGVGRSPNNSAFKKLNLAYDGLFIKVNQYMETSIPHIYAVGDIIGGYQLAHVASNEGIRAVNHIVGKTNTKQSSIPRCVYTFPEIASVGLTETEAKKAGYKVKVKKIDLVANGKAITANENKGFIKVIADETYGEILGAVIVGAHATEMISQVTSFINLEGTIDEMEAMIFPHPTISEGLFEAASAWLGKGIHYT